MPDHRGDRGTGRGHKSNRIAHALHAVLDEMMWGPHSTFIFSETFVALWNLTVVVSILFVSVSREVVREHQEKGGFRRVFGYW